MTPAQVADIYIAALEIIRAAEMETVNVTAIWEKVYSIRQYLQAQAAAEFAEVLK